MYMLHCPFLERGHQLRHDKRSFIRVIAMRDASKLLISHVICEQVHIIKELFGKSILSKRRIMEGG